MQELNSLKKFIKDNGELQQFKTGQLIYDREKDPKYLYLIIEGEARLIFKNFLDFGLQRFYLFGVSHHAGSHSDG